MGSWAVKAKVISAVKRTSNTNFLSGPSRTLPNRISKHLQPFQFPSLNSINKPKHTHAFIPIKPSPSLSSRVLHTFFPHLPTVIQPFDKMPQRKQCLETSRFYEVLDLVKISTIKPDIVTVIIVHALALKVGVLAHLPTSTSLLITYSRARDFTSSSDLFGEIDYKDVVVRNAMMTASVENRCYGVAVNIFVEMVEEGSGFDSGTLVIVISALCNMKSLFQGRVIHGLSAKAGMLSDSFLCNALIDMYAKCGDLSSSECMFVGMEFKDLISWNSMIGGCLFNNHPEKSLRYFRQMACCGKKADEVSLSCAIAASTRLGELGVGQVIHGSGIKLGYQESSHMSIANSLISLYSQCGDIHAAETIFLRMVFKDVISWNAIIDGFASNGKISEAFDLLHDMQLAVSVQPDKVTVVTIVPVCAELMLLREGKSIHGFTIRREMGPDLSVMNCILDMYLKCKRMKVAENLYQAMPEKDLVSWNTMISGYSQNGHSREAQSLFKNLLYWCSKCSLSTLLAILPSCDSPKSLQLGISIHCWQLKLGFLNNILAVNSLLHMYISCGDLIASSSLLRRIWVIADTACWNTVIVGCTQNGHFWEALETFNLMRRDSHVTHDSITLVSVISACGNLELVFEGKLCHGLAVKTLAGTHTRVLNALVTMYGRFGDSDSARSVFNFCSNRNLCSWNCIISAFSQNKDAKKALELFRRLDFEPNEISIATILSACTQLGVIRHGKQIHGRVFRYGFDRNSFITAALVDMYSNCGRLDVALQIFQYSHEKSVAAWNSMISAYGFHSNGQEAIEVFDEMIKSGINPSKTTFINLLSACSHSGLVNEGLCYYDRMFNEYGVQPLTEHHVCVVDMMGRSGRLSEAYEFIKRMPTQPEPGIWGALLSACNYHGDIEMGREVANILFGLEPENVGYYVSLLNMYVAAGRWSDAVELRTIIQDKRLKKPAGYSLIDVGLG